MLQEELQLDGAQLVDKFVDFLAGEDAEKQRALRDQGDEPQETKAEADAGREASRPGTLRSANAGALEPAGDAAVAVEAMEDG